MRDLVVCEALKVMARDASKRLRELVAQGEQLPYDVREAEGVSDFEGADSACKELIKRKFLVDYRPKAGIRISPHFYNTDEECDAIMEEIKKIRSAK